MAAVREEILRASIENDGRERTQCRYILSPTHGAWLGVPTSTAPDELRDVFTIRTALASGLGGHPREHLGEAETIWVAEQLHGVVGTDDGAAFEYAVSRLGAGRVVDTIVLLRSGVSHGALTADEASALVGRMRAGGRVLRRTHITPLTPADFQ